MTKIRCLIKIVYIFIFIFIFIFIYCVYIYIYLVHPCEKDDNGGCLQICIKNGTAVVCECNENFKLAADGSTCNKG